MRRDTNKVDPNSNPNPNTTNATPILTLTTWLKAKDAANAKDKKSSN